MNITHFEQQALNAISTDCFLEGAEGTEAVGIELWADCAAEHILDNTDITKSQLSGVVSSLIKKGLLNFHGAGRDSGWSLTEEGAKAIWG